MSKRIPLAACSEIPPGKGKEFVAEGRVVAVFNVDGAFYALDGLCPHAGGPLGTGTVRGNIVTCPWHGWQFDVTTGKHCLTQNIKANSFPVSIEEETVWIELPEEA